MAALVNLADQLAQSTTFSFAANMKDLITDLRERAAHQNAPTIDGVTLASLHSAKGLEWDAVFLAGMCEGLMPISLADTPELVAEERRLLYVGVTRARQRLEISYAKARTGGRASRKPTRFLARHWGEQNLGLKNKPGRPTTKAIKAVGANINAKAVKNNITPLSASDLEMFERLRKWRAETAREIDKPSFTILPDTALIALAQVRPADAAALIQVPGIGPVKLEKYGEPILKILAGA